METWERTGWRGGGEGDESPVPAAAAGGASGRRCGPGWRKGESRGECLGGGAWGAVRD